MHRKALFGPNFCAAPPHHKKNQYSFYMTRAFEREENFTKYHFVVNKILHPGAIFGPPGLGISSATLNKLHLMGTMLGDPQLRPGGV